MDILFLWDVSFAKKVFVLTTKPLKIPTTRVKNMPKLLSARVCHLHGNYQSPCQCHTIATSVASVCSVCSSGVTVVICFDMTVLVVHDYLKARSDKCNALKQI